MKKAYKILFRKPEGKRPLGEHRKRWDVNIWNRVGCCGLDLRISGDCPLAETRELSLEFIKGDKLFDQVYNYQLLKKNCYPWR
jgi:hypothetical protein